MDKFTNNPLSGVTIQNYGKRDGNPSGIYDANGNLLLKRFGTEWSENDQMGFDMLMKSMDYQYQADLLNYQNEYNSPVEQAKRLRDAGINPDLQQMQAFQSASSSASAPTTTLNAGQETMRKLDMAKSFIEMIPTAITMMQNIRSNNLGNSIKSAELENLAKGEALDLIGSSVTLEDLMNTTSIPFVSTSHIGNRKFRNSVQNHIDAYLNDASNRTLAKTAFYKNQSDYLKSRYDTLSQSSVAGFSSDDELFVKSMKEVNDVIMGDTKFTKSFHRDYMKGMNGSDVAKSDMAKYSAQEVESNAAAADPTLKLMTRAGELMESKDKGDKALGSFLYFLISISQSFKMSSSVGSSGNRQFSFGIN